MGLYKRPDSQFWWVFLEGTREKINTRIPHAAIDPDARKRLKIEAEAIYHQHMVRLAKQAVGLPTVETISFRAFAEWYDTNVIAPQKGAYMLRSQLRGLVRHFGDVQLSSITRLHIMEYEAARLKEAKRSTTTQSLRMLAHMFKLATGRYVIESPMADYTIRRAKMRPKATISAVEEPDLLVALMAIDPEIHDAYVVGVGSLLRQVNLLTLTRKQWTDPRIVVDAKAGPHVVDLSGPTMLQTRARDVLRKRLPSTRDGLFFPSWGSRFLVTTPGKQPGQRAASTFRRAVQKAFQSAGLPWGLDNHGYVWHSATRATGATRMLREYGVDIRTVQQMGPWASLDEMATYLGLNFAGNETGTKGPAKRD